MEIRRSRRSRNRRTGRLRSFNARLADQAGAGQGSVGERSGVGARVIGHVQIGNIPDGHQHFVQQAVQIRTDFALNRMVRFSGQKTVSRRGYPRVHRKRVLFGHGRVQRAVDWAKRMAQTVG